MAATVSLSSLITAVQLRADNGRLTSTQLTTLINSAYTQLYDKLTECFAEDYNLKQCTFSTVAGQARYPLSYVVTLVNSGPPGTVPTGFDSPAIVGTTARFLTSGDTAIIRKVSITEVASVTVYQVDLSDLSFSPNSSRVPSFGDFIQDQATGGSSYNGEFNFANIGIGAGDFYKLRGLDVNYQGDLYLELKPFIWKDRNLYTNASLYAGMAGPCYRYRIEGDAIVLSPTPQAAQLIRVSYTPAPSLLVNMTDTIDGVAGWEELVILQAARMCLIGEETDTTQIERQIAEVSARIDKMAASRDSGEPTVVAAMSDGGGNASLAATGVLGVPGGWDNW